MTLPASLARASWLAGLVAACNPGGTALAPELPQVEAGAALVGGAGSRPPSSPRLQGFVGSTWTAT